MGPIATFDFSDGAPARRVEGMTTRRSSATFLSLALAGCTSAHGLPEPSSAPAEPSALGACLAEGGALVELGSVDNNDQHDHGALLRFELSPAGLVAAAGEDGTLKFWTLDATLVGVADPGVLTYGAEVGGAPITDLAFEGETAIAGDVRGLVQGLGSAGTASVLSGTDPDVPIAAVAYAPASGWLAHAQGGPSAPDVVPLIVKTLDGETRWNLTATIDDIRDLAFDEEGRLYVAGAEDGAAVVEVRDAEDPTLLANRFSLGEDAHAVELARTADGATLVAATEHGLFALEENGPRLLRTSDAALRSIALTPTGDAIASIDEAGELVLSGPEGATLAQTRIPGAIGVRVTAAGDRLVVGSVDAHLRVLGCR